MTYAEVKQAWFDETFEFSMATYAQVERLIRELDGDDTPAMRWDMMQEELAFMLEELEMEFG